MEGDRWLERGARVGDYTIEDLLGEGGFGAVFRARSDAGVPAALKVFKTTAGELTAERLISQQNEIEALLKLDHSSLIELYGYGFVEGVGLYLAMELAVGEMLDTYLERVGALETLEAVRLARKVAEALAHCHARGVLHLDLKPSNIVIVDPHEPRVKVLDFGLATLTSSWQSDDTRVTAGTVGYMAPECLRSGRARPDPRMDLYALGTILYELVSGKLPFEGRGQRTIMMNRAVGEIVPLREAVPGVPPTVAALVDELLAQDPSQRPGSAAQLCARLKEIYYETLRGEEPEERGPQSARAPQSVRTFSLPPRHGDEVPFVGREGELSRLASRVLGATARGAAPVVIVGDAGIGKSRLCSELLNVVERDGAAVVIYARCRELSALVPYSPLREALSRVATATRRKGAAGPLVQAAIDAANDDDPELVTALVPELGRGLGDADTRRHLLRPASARRVAELVRTLVTRIAADLPVLVAIEDLHWGDESTLSVLEILSGSLGAAKVFLLGTTRPPSRVAWHGVELMDLGPLDREENAQLLAELALGGDEGILHELERRVPLLGVGNPLFGIQVIRNLEVEGFVTRTAFGTLCLGSRNLADYRAPDSITDALRRGVDSLSPDSREVLGVAALLGRQFLRSDLSALGLFDTDRIDGALREAETRCLCIDEPTSTAFVHEVVLEQLERRVVRADHREDHLRIARQLERRGADPGTLARHLERAGETLRAADAYVTAALASNAEDPAGASQKLNRAIDLVGKLPASAEQSRILLAASAEVVRARCLLGGTEELLKLVERCDADTPEASALLGAALARVHYARGDLDMALKHAARSITAAGKDPALERHRSAAANVIGRVHLAAGRAEDAARSLAAGCSIAERADDLAELCHSRGLYGVALGLTGDLEGAEREIQAAADLADRLADPARLLGAWHACALFAEVRYDWDLGVSSTAQLLAYAEEHKLGGHYLYAGTLFAGRHQFHVGHVHRARMLVTNALNLARIVGTNLGRALGQAFLGDVNLVEGRLDEALAAYERAIEQGSGPNGDELAVCLGLVGRMHAAALLRGDPLEIRRLGEEATSRIVLSGQRAVLLGAFERWAESLAEVKLGDEAAAVRARHEALASSLGAAGGTFWPRIPDLEARAAGMRARDYWRSRQGRGRSSGEWVLPMQPVSPARLLTTRGALKHAAAVESTAQLMPSRTMLAPRSVGLDPTVPRTGLLEALATVEGFIPALFEEEAGT